VVNDAITCVIEFFEKLNSLFGLSVECNVVEAERDKFPICVRGGKLTVIPEFFNHAELTDDVRTNIMAEMYSFFFLDKDKDGHVDINPGFMAKGICDKLGVRFCADNEIEATLRNIRRKIYDDIENGCYFEVGHKLRESAFVSYEVVDIVRRTATDTIITVKPIGHNLGKPNKEFTEEELHSRCCNFRDLTEERVSMRKNLYVVSGPSGVGKDAVVKKLLKKYPDIKKTVSITTRSKRSNETEGLDYYYLSKEEFYEYQVNNALVEYELYDGSYYGTLYSEIENCPEDKPLILVIDIRGRKSVQMRYPLANTIFISPPSFEALKERIIKRNENTPDEIEYRLHIAKEEMEDAKSYTHCVINDDIEVCVQKVANIIRQ